jgi:hypothetical protein
MRMTMPQILMLNHAAWVNSERCKKRVDHMSKKQKKQDDEDPTVWRGKRLSEMNSDELGKYYTGGI